MRKGQVNVLVFVIAVFVSGIFGVLASNYTSKLQYYKQGQVDYANGIIKYELKQQANGELKWQEKK